MDKCSNCVIIQYCSLEIENCWLIESHRHWQYDGESGRNGTNFKVDPMFECRQCYLICQKAHYTLKNLKVYIYTNPIKKEVIKSNLQSALSLQEPNSLLQQKLPCCAMHKRPVSDILLSNKSYIKGVSSPTVQCQCSVTMLCC